MNITLKSLLKGSGVLMISSMSLRLLNFIMIPLYSSYLTPAEYGVINITTDLTLILYYFFSFAIDWGMSAFFHEEDTEIYRRRVFSTVSVITLLGATLCLCAGALSRPLSRLLFDDAGYQWLVFCAFALAAVRLLFFAPNVNFRLRSRMGVIAIGDGVTLLLTLSLSVLFIVRLDMGYYALMLSPLIAEGCKTVAYFFLSRQYRQRRLIDKALARKLLRYSLPLVPTLLLSWVTQLSDQFIINLFHGQTAVGLYGVGVKIMGLLGVPAAAFRTAYTAYAFANANREGGPASFARIANLVCCSLLAMCLFLGLFSQEIVKILYAPAYHSAYPAAAFLVFSQLYYTLSYIINHGLSFQKRNKAILLVSVITATTNVVTNLLLIPSYGIMAAAATTCGSHILSMLLTYVLAGQQYKCPYAIGKLLLGPLACLGVCYLFMDSALPVRAVVLALSLAAVLVLWRRDIAPLAGAVIGRIRRRP